MRLGEITIEDEAMVHARETEPTVCIDVEYGEIEAYTYINKEQAQKIADHLAKVFELPPSK